MGNTYTDTDNSTAETSNIINAFLGAKAAATRNRQVDAEIAKMKIDADQAKAELKTKTLTANVQLLQTMTLAGMKPNINLDKFKQSGGSDLLGAIDSLTIGDPQKELIEKMKEEARLKAIEAKAKRDQETAGVRHGYKLKEIGAAGETKQAIQKQSDDAALVRATLNNAVKVADKGITQPELAAAGRAMPYAGGSATPEQSTGPEAPGQPNMDLPGVFGSHIFGKVITPDDVMATGINQQGAELFVKAAQKIKDNPKAKQAIIQRLLQLEPKFKSLLK